MADPLSALGAVAAASQLAGSVVKVIEIARKLHQEYKSPKVTREQWAQIEKLLDISQAVKENTALQVASISVALAKCNQCAVSLQTILQRIAVQKHDSRIRRLVKSVVTLKKEKEIEALFANLEREKSALHISMSNLTNLSVSQMHHDVGEVAGDITEIVDATSVIPNINVNTEQTILKVTDIHTILTSQHMQSPIENCSKKHYLVPNGRSVKDFVGREDTLELIDKAFSIDATKTKTVVIRGLGGQGKTQIALEHCRRAEASGVGAVFWVDAHSASSVKKTFLTISGKIKRPHDVVTEEDAVSYVLNSLKNWGKSFIMVFDNYDDVITFNTIQDFIPDGGNACIIVTSRHEKSEELAEPDNAIHLGGLVGEESLELLRKTSRLKSLSGSLDDARTIVNRLGHHPLAITQAGSYIREQKIPLSRFMADYDSRREKILKYNSQLSLYRRRLNNQEGETVLNVFTTWELSYQLLLETVENANEKADLLTLFAFFDCKDIPEDLFATFCHDAQRYKNEEEPWPWPVQFLLPCLSKSLDDQSAKEPRKWDNQAFTTILIDLAQLSLVQSWARDEDNVCHLSLHPLVRDWIRIRTEDDRVQFFSNISAWTLKALLDDRRDASNSYDIPLSTKQTILSHIEVYKAHTKFLNHRNTRSAQEEVKERPDIPAESMSGFLYSCGFFKEYDFISEHIIKFRQRALELDHTDTLIAMHNFATACYEKGDLAQAESRYRELLEKCLAVFGMNDIKTIHVLYVLAWILYFQNKSEEAEEKAFAALSSLEGLLREDHPTILDCLNTIALILQRLGRSKESEALRRKILAKREAILGTSLERNRQSLLLLGLSHHSSGQLELAEETLRAAVKDAEISLGPEHPITLRSVGNLGVILQDQERYAEAEDLMKRVYEGLVKVLGQDHRETLSALTNLGIVLLRQERYVEVEEMMRRAYNGRVKVLGRNHEEILTTLLKLGTVLRDQKRYAEVEEIMRHAYDGRVKVLGRDHEETLTTLLKLGLYFGIKRETRKRTRNHYLSFNERLWHAKCTGKDHPSTISCLEGYTDLSRKMAESLRKLEKDKELLNHLKQTLDVYEKCVANEPQYTAGYLDEIADVLYKQGKDEEALSFYERAAAEFEKLHGTQDYRTIICLISTGWLLEKGAKSLSEGDRNEEMLLHYATAGYIRIHGDDDNGNIYCLESAGSLLEEQAYQLYILDKKEEALAYYERAALRYEELHGREHEDTIRCLDWLSGIPSELVASSSHLNASQNVDGEEDTQSEGSQHSALVLRTSAAETSPKDVDSAESNVHIHAASQVSVEN